MKPYTINHDDRNAILTEYYNVETGLASAQTIYQKLNKKYTLKLIKEVLSNIHNKQVKDIPNKKYIQITAPEHSYQADLTFYEQYKRINKVFGILFTIININTKKAYIYPLKNKSAKSIIEAFKKFIKDVDKIDLLECDF